MAQLLRTMLNHDRCSSPVRHCPALILLRLQPGLSTVTSFTYVITSKHGQNTIERHNTGSITNFTNLFVSSLLTLFHFGRRRPCHIPGFFVYAAHMIIHVVHPCFCLCMTTYTVPKPTSSYCASSKDVYRSWPQYGMLTLVKQTGLRGSNLLGHGVDYNVSAPLVEGCFKGVWCYGTQKSINVLADDVWHVIKQ